MIWLRELGTRRLLLIAFAGLTSSLAGLGTVFFLSLLNAAISGGDAATSRLPRLLCVAIAMAICHVFSSSLVQRLGSRALAERRRALVDKVQAAPLQAIERIGQARILSALTSDAPAITAALDATPALCSSMIATLGALTYLGTLSPRLLGVTLFLVTLGVGSDRILGRFQRRQLRARQSVQESLLDLFAQLLTGAKELRLNASRSQTFVHGDIGTGIRELNDLEIRASLATSLVNNWFRLVLFSGLALLATVGRDKLNASAAQVSGFVVTTMYLLGSLGTLFGSSKTFALASVADERLKRLTRDIAAAAVADEPFRAADMMRDNKTEIDVADLVFKRSGTGAGFVLGPLSLRIARNSIVFIIGGNGSGKSTLGKVLCGLYPHVAGDLFLDETPIERSNRAWYRQHFSAVFADFHVFKRCSVGDVDAEAVRRYLALLELKDVVDFDGEAFSTTKDLSTGQLKRLALVVAYVEDRPIYLFDEWAADQDPGFKTVFYRRLLPELKARGKTVICISHDERYFDVADQLVKLEAGRLAEDGTAAFVARLARVPSVRPGRP